jgi:hypothetical protein
MEILPKTILTAKLTSAISESMFSIWFNAILDCMCNSRERWVFANFTAPLRTIQQIPGPITAKHTHPKPALRVSLTRRETSCLPRFLCGRTQGIRAASWALAPPGRGCAQLRMLLPWMMRRQRRPGGGGEAGAVARATQRGDTTGTGAQNPAPRRAGFGAACLLPGRPGQFFVAGLPRAGVGVRAEQKRIVLLLLLLQAEREAKRQGRA